MNYLRRHWYDIGGIICLIVVIIDIIFWKDFGTLRALLILNFASMLGHQYEEYGFPGGEPGVMNVADKHSDIPDRWPLNQNSAMWANLGCSYLFFLIPVFFPNVIWLGLAPMLAVFGQMVAHGADKIHFTNFGTRLYCTGCAQMPDGYKRKTLKLIQFQRFTWFCRTFL